MLVLLVIFKNNVGVGSGTAQATEFKIKYRYLYPNGLYRPSAREPPPLSKASRLGSHTL